MQVGRKIVVAVSVTLLASASFAGDSKAPPPLPVYNTPAILPPDPVKKVPPTIPLEPTSQVTPSAVASEPPPSVPAPAPLSPIEASKAPPPLPPVEKGKTPDPLPPIPTVPAQLPAQIPSQIPSQLPVQMPSQLPSQLPVQMPSQLPTQFPSQFPSQFPAIPAAKASSTAAPAASTVPAGFATPSVPPLPTTVPAATSAPAASTVPAANLTIAGPGLPTPSTSTFNGFAMSDRAYEILSLNMPTPSQMQTYGARGSMTIGTDGYTLYNFRVAGPYVVRSQPSPFAGTRDADASFFYPVKSYPEVNVWNVYADLFPATTPPMYAGTTGYQPRRAGAVWLRVMQKIDRNVYIQAPGPQLAIVDGQGQLWRSRFRILASGLLGDGVIALQSTTSPSAPNTEDIKNTR